MTQSIILIVAALLLAAAIIVMLRAGKGKGRGEAGRHVDTSVTAVGAASEAVRNVAEEVTEVVEDSLKADVAASGAKADDVSAAMGNAAAIMASGGAAAGAVTMTDIGVPTGGEGADDLRRIKGLGPKLKTTLNSLGVTRFDQIAAWEADDVARIDAQLGTFKGRIERDNWIEQARYLAAGDVAGFEARFGKLDGPVNG